MTPWESVRNGEAEKFGRSRERETFCDSAFTASSNAEEGFRAGADFGKAWRAGELEEKLEKAIQLFRDDVARELHKHCVDRGYVEVLQSDLWEARVEIERLGGRKARDK